MALDPYRTLGLPADASLDEVKRAYRRLAKRYHPDAAGDAATVRFLAVRAAYDAIIGGPGGRGRGRRPSGPAWAADPERARATRDAYRATGARRPSGPTTRPDGGRPGPRERPPAASGGPTGSAGQERGTRDPRSGDTRSGRAAGGSAPRPKRSSTRKATLSSTSYDEASHGAFEPGWDGGAWYGPSSGTYWTLNPREYADPRKHGPEYQARARRAARGQAETAVGDGVTSGPAAGPQADREAAAAADGMPATAAGRTVGADASAGGGDRQSSSPPADPTGGPATGRSIPDRPLPAPGGGVLTAGLAAGGLVAIPSFAVLLSSEMAGDPALATAALIAPPLAAFSVALTLLLVRRVRGA